MTVVFMDGFDTYSSDDIYKHWSDGSAMSSISGLSRPRSSQSLYFSGANVGPPTKVLSAYRSGGVIGFGFYFTNTASSHDTVLTVMDSTTEQVSVRMSAGQLYLTRSGTWLAGGTTVLAPYTWYYIEFKFTISNSAGYVELHLNGATEIAQVGPVDTQNTGNAGWNSFRFARQNAGGNAAYIDDVYVVDPSISPHTTFLGPVSVVALRPSAAGAHADWTPSSGTNHGAVADVVPDGDTTFNQSSTADQIDTFVYQNMPVASGAVYAVQQVISAKHDGGARSIAPVVRQAGTDYIGATKAVSNSYLPYKEILDEDPSTGSDWTVSGVNSAEFGYKLVS